MYTHGHLGKMETLSTYKYLPGNSGFATELDRENEVKKKKLEQIRAGKSVYSIDRKVTFQIIRIP